MLAVYPRKTATEKHGEERSTAIYCVNPMFSAAVLAWIMDKKEIISPMLTFNFLIWVGGVFLLLLFAFLAHFVWKVF